MLLGSPGPVIIIMVFTGSGHREKNLLFLASWPSQLWDVDRTCNRKQKCDKMWMMKVMILLTIWFSLLSPWEVYICWAWAINRKSFWSQFQILSNFNGFPLKGLQQGFPQESNCQSAFWLENIKMREILRGNVFLLEVYFTQLWNIFCERIALIFQSENTLTIRFLRKTLL